MAKNTSANNPPNLLAYHKTILCELSSVRDRIRHLVRHWPTDGAFKEAALRAIMRRHLPESWHVGRGFVCTPEESSSEIDILVTDRNEPTLFKDGDLVIVSRNAVRAIAEVKTAINDARTMEQAIRKLARNRRLCKDNASYPWSGLFVYGGKIKQDEVLLRAANKACLRDGVVQCIVYGDDIAVERIMHGWIPGLAIEGLDYERERLLWLSWRLPKLAPAFFLTHLLVKRASWAKQEGAVWLLPNEECKPCKCIVEGETRIRSVTLASDCDGRE